MGKVKTVEKVVELKHIAANGAKKTMWRNGRQFEVKKPQVLELTEEEVEVFENDRFFSVSDPSDTSESDSSEETTGSEGDAQSSDSETQEDDSSEDQGSEDTDSDDPEADSGSDSESVEDEDDNDPEAQVTELVQNNDRVALNKLAVEAGIVEKAEDAETKFKSKSEVAQAIVEAQASNSDGGATS